MLLSKMEGSEEDTPITNVANARPSLTFQEQLIMAEKSHQFLLLGCAGFTPIKSVAMENTFQLRSSTAAKPALGPSLW